MALPLCGCVTNPAGTLPLAIDLSALDTCARLLAPVALPKITAKTDARVAFVRDEAALITARNEIAIGRGCIVDVKQRYGTGK